MQPVQQQRQGGSRFLRTVEWLGNMLPHPVILFIILITILLISSAAGQYFAISAPDPRPEGMKDRAADGMIYVISLINAEGIRKILSNVVTNFTSFAPLGTVLVSMLGIGIAERSGLISAAMRLTVMKAPRKLTTLVVVFVGIISNIAADVGFVVLIPLSAMIFHALGRHPLAGLAASFAGVAGGYSANLLLGTVDPLLSGITQQAAQIIDADYEVGAEANWYFMFSSTFLIAFLGYIVTEKIVEPQLGPYQRENKSVGQETTTMDAQVTAIEKKGLMWTGVAFCVLIALVALTVLPADGILRNQQTGLISNSPFLRGIVVFMFVFFSVLGLVYGYVTKTFRKTVDIVDAMKQSMSRMGLYLVIIFFASQFVAFFNWTNIGEVIAVKGANFLSGLNLHGAVLFVGFILICALINFMIGAASAQWAVSAPIFVPMLMLAGYSPETIQAAYRIGDSVTNIVSPMIGYFGLIVAIAVKYQKNTGIGTLISIMLPYSVSFLIGWSLFFCLWIFVLGFPPGPGTSIYFTPGG